MKNKQYYISYSFLSAFVVLLFFVYAYNLTVNYRPSFFHQWRQSDCLSIATNYLHEGMHFLEPKTHWQGNGDGGAVSEMPLINYSVAYLWKLFGKSEGIYRMFNYIIFITGIFILFKSLLRRTNDTWLSFFLVSLLLTSPLLVYYSFNFLSDVPALIMAVISFCFLLKAHDDDKKWPAYVAVLTGTLAALLKASDGILIVLMVLLFLLEITGLNKKMGIRPIFKSLWLPLLFLLISVFCILSWYSFAKDYNAIHKSELFLVGILPIWEMDSSAILANLTSLLSDKFSIFHNRPMLFLFFMVNVYIWFHFRSLDGILKLSYCLTGVFFITYILLFFKVFDNHDYYLINLMIFPVINFYCVGQILQKKKYKMGLNKWMITAVLLVVLFNGLYASAIYRSRTIKGDPLCYWYPFLTHIEKDITEYQIWTYEQGMSAMELVEPKFRELGISRNELVLSVPDFSPNNSLYLYDQKGYTVSYGDFCKDTAWKKPARYKLCKYLIINDTTVKQSKGFSLIKDDLSLLYTQHHLEIYKLAKTP